MCLSLCLLTGCSKTTSTPQGKLPEEKVLKIGLVPEQDVFQEMERYQPLADYISTKIGMKVNLKVLPAYGNIIDNFLSLHLDGAFLGSFAYALAHSKLGLQVLARPEYFDFLSTYHGVIFVRRDSGIRAAKDMKGKRFVFVDKATTAGYLLPLAYFKEHGINDYKGYFKESYFAGTHGNAIKDVLNGKADIGAAKNTVYERMAKTDSRITNDLIILEASPDLPENSLAVRKELSDSIKNKLKGVLLTMADDRDGRIVMKNFGARRFIVTADEDYEPVYDYARKIGLNLATYDYEN